MLLSIINNRKNEIYKKSKIPNDLLNSSRNSNYKKLLNDDTYVERTNYQASKYYE